MPVSKRSKVVSLTKVKKHKSRGESGREVKEQWMDSVRTACEEEDQHVYLVEFVNQRNSLLKLVRDLIKPGKVFYGKNKVIQRALGTSATTECLPNIYKLSKHLTGHRALLVCKHPMDKLRPQLQKLQAKDFARAGFVATEDLQLKEGSDALAHFPHSLEQRFRSLGIPTLLKNGKIILLGDYTVCKKGQPLTPEQAQILKHLGVKMAEFHINLLAEWHKGRYRVVDDAALS
ncbi:mRNA turnover 4 (MRT4) family protein [Besnoitia besnoiti]|uniref:Ribosome assembly factor mrt4 n=1 Tax=Besnoitia besnoiti TaxID=94643 RepID=A0A2A9M5F9_BESBE|nr:mRNA turnover 4 (MRT4) family protein [Besnoitia besnoiti]PFH33179.1 mRNA turnover 4 (MRT4) family protein [Besnoitia besnoiti]